SASRDSPQKFFLNCTKGHNGRTPPMASQFSLSELEAYLDEALPVEQMARVESALRADAQLAGQLTEINGRRDAGLHSLGEIWRRHRLTCPTREQLGSMLLGVLEPDVAD